MRCIQGLKKVVLTLRVRSAATWPTDPLSTQRKQLLWLRRSVGHVAADLTRSVRTTFLAPRACGLALLGLALLTGCEREARSLRPDVPFAASDPSEKKQEANAYAQSEAKRLFNAMNCTGCHANGGGGMGPPLMDDQWIYGSSPDEIRTTILKGRPNGMPAFEGKIPHYQVDQLVAYVRSMSGWTGNAAPGRSDHMWTGTPETSRDPLIPVPQIDTNPGRAP